MTRHGGLPATGRDVARLTPTQREWIADIRRHEDYHRRFPSARVPDGALWQERKAALIRDGVPVDAILQAEPSDSEPQAQEPPDVAQPLAADAAPPALATRGACTPVPPGAESAGSGTPPTRTLDELPLEQPELRNLRGSGIPDEVIAQNRIRTERGRDIVARVCDRRSRAAYFINCPRVNPRDPSTATIDEAIAPIVGATFPCAMPGTIDRPYGYRIRLRHPIAKKAEDATNNDADAWKRDKHGRVEGRKYESPWGHSAMVFFPASPEGLGLYASANVWDVTEGEKKAIVLAMCGLAAIGATGIYMLLDYDHVRALAIEHLKATGGDPSNEKQVGTATTHIKRTRPASEVWRLHPKLAGLGDVRGKTLRIGFDHWLEKEPTQSGIVDEVRAAVRLAGAWYRAGGERAVFAFPRAFIEKEGSPKGWDDLFVRGGLHARGLSLVEHDLDVDAAEALDHDAGRAEVLRQLGLAIELPRERVCGGWRADEIDATRWVQEQCGWRPRPFIGADSDITSGADATGLHEVANGTYTRPKARAMTMNDHDSSVNVVNLDDVRYARRDSHDGQSGGRSARVGIHYDGGNAAQCVDGIARVMARIQPPRVFERDGTLVRVTRGKARTKTARFGRIDYRISRKRIVVWGSAELASEVSRHVHLTANGPHSTLIGLTATSTMTHALLALGYHDNISFPGLVGFAEVPVMRGADVMSPATRTYEPDLEVEIELCHPDLAEVARRVGNPTHADAQAAYARFAHRMRGFPWVKPHHCAACFSHAASHSVQFDGVVPPVFAYNAPKPGTGKSLAMLVATLIGTGYAPRKGSLSDRRTEDEFAKRLVAFSKAGERAVTFDNHKGEFSSGTLESASVDQTVSERNLGTNSSFDGTMHTVISVTGNNLKIGDEMLRRTIPIELDARMDHPETRAASSFDEPELIKSVIRDLPDLIVDVLTVLRAHVLAGSPTVTEDPPLADYPTWERVRQAVAWASGEDPAGGRVAAREAQAERSEAVAFARSLAEICANPDEGLTHKRPEDVWLSAGYLAERFARTPNEAECSTAQRRWAELRDDYLEYRDAVVSRNRSKVPLGASAVGKTLQLLCPGSEAHIGDIVIRRHGSPKNKDAKYSALRVGQLAGSRELACAQVSLPIR